MRVRPIFAGGVMFLAACSPSTPTGSTEQAAVRDLLDRAQVMTQEGRHGPYHKADNALQTELWSRLKSLPPGPSSETLILEAAECVYTRYDENYAHGVLWHWPYLSSRRAIELCDRLASSADAEIRERALWIKAFALRCPPTEPWGDAERDQETYAEQVKWKPDYEAAREIYRKIAKEFPSTARGKAAARLAQRELSFMLPKGPKERDPRNPDLIPP